MPHLLDEVRIRLASADEGAVRQVRMEIGLLLPGTRFGRVWLGRSGDWMCEGWLDDGASALRVPEWTRQAQQWLESYSAIRRQLVTSLGGQHPVLPHLDATIAVVAARLTEAEQRRQRR